MGNNNNDWTIDGYDYEESGYVEPDYSETPNEDWIDTGHFVESQPEKRGTQNPIVVCILVIGSFVTLWIIMSICSLIFKINNTHNLIENKIEQTQEYFADKNYGTHIPPETAEKEVETIVPDSEVVIEEHPGVDEILEIELIDGQVATVENIREIAAHSIKVATGVAKETNNGRLLECYDYVCNVLTINNDNQSDLTEEVRFPAILGNYTVRDYDGENIGVLEGANFSIEGIGYSVIVGEPEIDLLLLKTVNPGEKICFILMRSDVYEAIRTIEKERNVVLLDMGVIVAGTLPMMDLTLADSVISAAPNMIGKLMISASNGELTENDLKDDAAQLGESTEKLALLAIKTLYMYSADHDINISANDLGALKQSILEGTQTGGEKFGGIIGSEDGFVVIKELLKGMF